MIQDDIWFVRSKLNTYRSTEFKTDTKWDSTIRGGYLNDAIWLLWSQKHLTIDERGRVLAMSQLDQYDYLTKWVKQNDS